MLAADYSVVLIYLLVIAAFATLWFIVCCLARATTREHDDPAITPEWPKSEQQLEADESARFTGKARGERNV